MGTPKTGPEQSSTPHLWCPSSRSLVYYTVEAWSLCSLSAIFSTNSHLACPYSLASYAPEDELLRL